MAESENGGSGVQMVSEELVREALYNVFDPELRMSIVELGLVYDVAIEDGTVKVIYTLTSPGCPLGPVIDGQIQDVLMDLPGVKEVSSELTFNPPWDPRTMASEDVKMQLGIW
jgi:metal-sulfur cluster biosynthetic enzyme